MGMGSGERKGIGKSDEERTGDVRGWDGDGNVMG